MYTKKPITMTKEQYLKYLGDDPCVGEFVLQFVPDEEMDEAPIPFILESTMRRLQDGTLKDDSAFYDKSFEPCYVPGSAQEWGSVYNYHDLYEIVKNWLRNDGKQWGKINPHLTADILTGLMYQGLTWQYPSTWLDQLLTMD
jgi:hypothetical protein